MIFKRKPKVKPLKQVGYTFVTGIDNSVTARIAAYLPENTTALEMKPLRDVVSHLMAAGWTIVDRQTLHDD